MEKLIEKQTDSMLKMCENISFVINDIKMDIKNNRRIRREYEDHIMRRRGIEIWRKLPNDQYIDNIEVSNMDHVRNATGLMTEEMGGYQPREALAGTIDCTFFWV